MNNDKIKRLTKYADGIKERMGTIIPKKHKDHKTQYEQFLRNELSSTLSKIESLKLAGTK